MEIMLNDGIKNHLTKLIENQKPDFSLAIICGSSSYPKELMEQILSNKKIGELRFYSGFSPNPKINEIYNALEQLWPFGADLIIGVGGGSVLDIAKILRLFVNHPCNFYELENYFKGDLTLKENNSVPLCLLPTTAGSGAEMTTFSVVYIENEKYSFAHEKLLPDFIIADPILIYDAPNSVLAASAMDALSQGIESFWSRNSNMDTKVVSLQAIKLLWENISDAVLNRNQKAIEKIIEGSNLSGKAINQTKTTGNHALSYKITTEYEISHGHCVGMLLPEFFNLHGNLLLEGNTQAAQAVALQNEIATHLNFHDFQAFSDEYFELLKALKLKNFSQLSLTHNFDKHKIVNSVNTQRLKNHPVDLSQEHLLSIFEI